MKHVATTSPLPPHTDNELRDLRMTCEYCLSRLRNSHAKECPTVAVELS